MTKQEAKHLSEILKAYSEGKTIQFALKGRNDWDDYYVLNEDVVTLNTVDFDYRIKPEPKYRPYKNAKEFLMAQKEHGPYLQRMRNAVFRIPTLIGDESIEFQDGCADAYEDLIESGKWQDSTPCGVAE